MDDGTLAAAWQETVRRDPHARAVIDGASGRVWTRGELADAAEAWRMRWTADAALHGRRVLMAEPNGPRWFEVFLGLQLAGAIVVPADPTEPAPALHTLAGQVRAAALWHDGELRRLGRRSPARDRELCLVKLTSGSTGAPRARGFTHAQMLADGRQVCASMGITAEDLNLAVIPLGHSYGLGNLVLPLLDQGTPLLAAASPLPQALAADCHRWRPTVFPAVPTLLRALVRADVPAGALASLRRVISAGALLAPEIAVAFARKFGRSIHSFYGSSETGGITYDRTGEAAASGRSVGTPLAGVTLHLGRGGRFTVESPAVMGGGRFSPPDRARLTPAGELVLIGRVGRAMKIAGRRLDPGEIERALLDLPGVLGASVGPHPLRPDALAAVVATERDAATLRAALAARVAAWKIPERWVIVPELPVNARGKVDRAAVRALLAT